MANYHITRINDTKANLWTGMDLAQIAVMSDENEELVWKNDDATRMYVVAPQKYWNGAAYTYCDVDFNDVSVHGDIDAQEYIRRLGVADDFIRMQNGQFEVFLTNINFMQLYDTTQRLIRFNEGGGDIDFEVDTSARQNSLFVQGSSGRVGVGMADPAAWFEVEGTDATVPQFRLTNADVAERAFTIGVGDDGDSMVTMCDPTNSGSLLGIGNTTYGMSVWITSAGSDGQLGLYNSNGTSYADFIVDSSGHMTIAPSGTDGEVHLGTDDHMTFGEAAGSALGDITSDGTDLNITATNDILIQCGTSSDTIKLDASGSGTVDIDADILDLQDVNEVRLGNHTGSTITHDGYITVYDTGGVARKLMVGS